MVNDLFPRMPRVDYEVLDRRLRLNPDYQGRHVVVLGCLDVDGYGYLNPDPDAKDYAAKFVKPATVLLFNELTRATDLQAMSRLYKPNSNVGMTDEITPAIAELQQQGATNISFIRLDLAMAQDVLTSTMQPVLQSTGLPPAEWLTQMGFTKDASGKWSAKAKLDPLADYIPSVAYRKFVASLLGINPETGIDAATAQAHVDPTCADLRYYAIGKAMNNLIGEDVDSVVLAVPPGFVSPARAWKSVGNYPLRPGDQVDAAEVIEEGAPTFNNAKLSKIVLNPGDLTFLSFDAIGYDKATITLGAGVKAGDTLVVTAGSYAVDLKAVALDPETPANYAKGEFAVYPTPEATCADLENAAMGWLKDVGETRLRCPAHAVANGAVLTLTSLVPGGEGRLGVHVLSGTGFTVSAAKATASLKVTDNTKLVEDESTITITPSGGTAITVMASATPGAGKFVPGADAAASAVAIAAALDLQGAGKLYAFAFGDTVIVTSVLGGTAHGVVASTNAATAVTVAVGSAGLSGTLTLSGSHYLAAERNFAHLLANFAFWQSYYETACKGFIGSEPWDTDLDGLITAEVARAVIGQERTNVQQYVDDASGNAYADNGKGLLGFVGCKGLDGTHCRRSNPDFPVGYKMFATSLGMTQIQLSQQENVVMYCPTLNDTFLVDSDKGEYMDLGARLRMTAGDVFAYNPVAGRYDESNGRYLTNAAVSVAGLDAIRPAGRSLTKLKMRSVVPLRRLSQTQMDALLKARFIPLQQDLVLSAAEIQADDTAAFNINENHRSDFVKGLSVDVLDSCVEDIREVARPLIGRGMSPQLVEHFSTEAEEALSRRLRAGHIQDYRFTFISSPSMQVLGEGQFYLEVVPAFELRRLRMKAGLSMPTNALTAGGGTF